jgi:hypothetical protein
MGWATCWATFGGRWATFGGRWATIGGRWATFGGRWATLYDSVWSPCDRRSILQQSRGHGRTVKRQQPRERSRKQCVETLYEHSFPALFSFAAQDLGPILRLLNLQLQLQRCR